MNEFKKIISELQTYQVELEMQNEELRRVQKELQISRNKYFDLFDQAPTGYLLLDQHLIVQEANLAALALCGLSTAEIQHKLFLFMLRSKDHEQSLGYLSRILNEQEAEDITVRLDRKDGSYRTVRIKGILSPHGNEQKQVLVSLTDLTDLHSAQEALSQSENLYRSLVYSSEDHIFMLSVDGHFMTSNGNITCLPELTETVIGKHISEVFPEDHTKTMIEQINRVLLDGTQVNFDNPCRIGSQVFYMAYHLYPINRDGFLWAVGGVCHDVSDQCEIQREKEALEAQLRQSQKLESLGNLAGGIAHDFNNILSSILGFSDLALDEIEPGTTLEDDIMEIKKSGTRAKELVQQILAFARSSNKEMAPVYMPAMVNEATKFIRSTTPTSVAIDSLVETDSYIWGNETEILQVLMNLLTNGAQAMEENGGVLSIAVQESCDDGDIVIRIADTGSGIDSQIIGKIFEPYFTTKDIGEGSGMGLAVVHGIIESYGGEISVESIKDQGTTFTVRIPIYVHEVENQSADELEETIIGGDERVLLVDDEPSITRVGTKLLKHLGYQVESTNDSFEALKLFRHDPDFFDLVISDVTMPGMTGEKLASELMKINPKIPVILCTGYSRKVTEQDLKKWRIKALLKKPYERRTFAGMVRSVLDEKQS